MAPNHEVTSGGGSEAWFDSSTGGFIINETALPDQQIMSAMMDQAPELAALVRWTNETHNHGRRVGGIFDRDRFTTPSTLFEQFRVATDAAESDDVVSGVLESTESLAFGKMSVEADDEDEEDIWNQIIDGLELDARIREMWSELFVVSQFYCAILWGRRSYTVGGKSKKGVKRKKQFNNLYVPIGLSILDPLKVVPVGNFMFGQERLAYIANPAEATQFGLTLAGYNSSDLIVSQLIESEYEPSESEMQSLINFTGRGVNLDNLFLLKSDSVFRHTATRPAYKRFSPVHMKSIFELLDMKYQLREMDRTHIIGGTNFIVLVKKGSDEFPAKPSEIAQLAANVRTVSRVPIIVGDHRIEIEIITPKLDMTLQPEKYNTLDARITARLYLMFMTGNFAAGAKGDDSIKLARVVARGMESRRHMLRKTLEKYVLNPTAKSNDAFTDEPDLLFHPKRIALDFDNNVAVYLQDLRDRGDISRETLLEELDLDQDEEARKREREKDSGYDKIFAPTNVPFSAPAGAPGQPGAVKPDAKPGAKPAATQNVKTAGRRGGGNKNGGGSNPNSKAPNSNPVKSGLEEDLEEEE